jgi:hypothetical protein
MENYQVIKNDFDEDIICRTNDDGSITSFMADPANSDYQRYLNPEAEHFTPNLAD